MGANHSLARNVGFMLVGEIISRVLSFVLIVLLTRFLGDYGLGLYSFAFAFTGLLFTFSDFGLSVYLLKELGRDRKKAAHYLSNVLTLKAVLLLAMVLAGTAFMVKTTHSAETMLTVSILTIAMFFNFLTEPLKSIFTAFEKTQYYSVVVIAERVIAVAGGTYVLIAGKGIIALMAVFIVSYFFTFLLTLFIVWTRFSKFSISFDLKAWVAIIKGALPFWFSLLFISVYYRIDTVMLTWMTNFSVVGWYNAAYKMVEGLSFIPVVFVSVALPIMSAMHEKSSDLLKIVHKNMFSYLIMIALPMGVGTTFLAERLIAFFYGGQLTANLTANAPIALKILIWAEVMIFANYSIGYLLNSINKQTSFTLVTGVYTVVNAILNLFLISRFSYAGAAWATVFTQIGIFLTLYTISAKKGYALNLFSLVWKPAIAAGAMLAVLRMFGQLQIVLLVPIAAAAYIGILFALRGIGRIEIDIAKSLVGLK